MLKKLTAIGNSYGLIIDKSILELLDITPDSELKLSTDGSRLIVEPVRTKRAPRPSHAVAPPPPRSSRPGAPLPPRSPRIGVPRKQPW